MSIPFSKMQALGNDFVVFDFTKAVQTITADQARLIADRHLGIGCDQILIVESSDRSDIDFKYRILNADGSEVGQCGNGARCILKFLHDKELSNMDVVRVETISGDMQLELLGDSNLVKVDMGVPNFEPSGIPLAEDSRQDSYSINKDGDAIRFSALSIGNPHAVIQVEDVAHAPVGLIGPMIESHPIFPERANVGFMQIIDRNEIKLRVFERGTGETLACGSGACAAAVAGMQMQLLDDAVSVHLTGGELSINWAGAGNPVYMTGPANTSFTGEISL